MALLLNKFVYEHYIVGSRFDNRCFQVMDKIFNKYFCSMHVSGAHGASHDGKGKDGDLSPDLFIEPSSPKSKHTKEQEDML